MFKNRELNKMAVRVIINALPDFIGEDIDDLPQYIKFALISEEEQKPFLKILKDDIEYIREEFFNHTNRYPEDINVVLEYAVYMVFSKCVPDEYLQIELTEDMCKLLCKRLNKLF